MKADPALVGELRRLAVRRRAASPPPAPAPVERCDLCGVDLPDEHRHMIHVDDHRLACVCEPCRALLGGDGAWRPTATRVVPLDGLDLPPELWAGFQIPIGLAFFLRAGGGVAAFYPSPAGATECELDLESWEELVARNPVLEDLEPEVEALLVNRLARPPRNAILPIDECYRLVGLVRRSWRGFAGGDGVRTAIDGFFAELDARAARA